MIRIAVVGASGKVGQALLDQIAAAPDLTLAEAINQSGAPQARQSFTTLDAACLDADAVVDFSSPTGTMALLDRLGTAPVPLVVGTTGFSADQVERIEASARARPTLLGANFTAGFEVFAKAARTLADQLPEARVTVAEVYNARKKPAPSGTTRRLLADLGEDGREIETSIGREGDTPGINRVICDLGPAMITLELTVAGRTAYAVGALEAARWLIGRANDLYAPKDMIQQEKTHE